VNLLFPLGMAALGALVPLVALYLLKQKRVEQKVPTNFLWARAVEDLRASSLFQRLRAGILLLLQAIAVALFALAAAGASLALRVGDAPRRLIVLLDRSASMKCTDEADGRSRIDVAKELARRQADALAGADEMMVVAFDVRAEVTASFTSDAARLRRAIDGISARDLPTRAADALTLAVSFARATQGFDAQILLYSDGALESDLPSVPFPVQFAKVGTSGANQGITGVQVARAPGERAQVFVRVENGSAEAVERTVALRRGKETLDARAVSLPADGAATAFFELPEPETAEPVVLTAAIDGSDVLAADDSASFVLRPAVPRTGLLVASGPRIYLDPAKIERLHPGLALAAVSPEEAAATFAKGDASVDFVCYDGVEPKELPPVAAQLYVDAAPPGSGLVRGPAQQYPIVIDWDRRHPTTARCQFDDLLVTESWKVGGSERSRTLVDSTGGPLALLTPVPGREVVVLAFSPANSNLPLKLSWPLFLANTLDFLLSRTERSGEEPVLATGAPLSLVPHGRVKVTSPSGVAAEVDRDDRGRAVFTATDEAGVWTVKDGDGPADVRAYALLSASEIRVAPRERLTLGGAPVESSARDARGGVLLRDPLLLAALGVLMIEWAIWCSRR
jgi:Ca-activated chloride channel family protein